MMAAWIWLVLALAVIAIFGIWLWRLAVRIDRLHRRVISTRATLGRSLVKRASDSLQLAASGLLDEDAARDLAVAARRSLATVEIPVVADGIEDMTTAADVVGDRRYVVESDLSRALRQALDQPTRDRLELDPLGTVMLADLDSTSYRIQVSRTLHNQDVSLVRNLRGRLPARLFHLAGHAPMPQYVDLDDEL